MFSGASQGPARYGERSFAETIWFTRHCNSTSSNGACDSDEAHLEVVQTAWLGNERKIKKTVACSQVVREKKADMEKNRESSRQCSNRRVVSCHKQNPEMKFTDTIDSI